LHVLNEITKEMEYIHTQFVDAKTSVRVPIEFTADKIKRGRPGMPWECVIARELLDYAKKNPHVLSHPCLHVYVTRRAIYIIDRKVNRDRPPMYLHSVRYFVDLSKVLDAFDDKNVTPAKFKKAFGDRMILHLRPAKKRGGDEGPHARDTRVRKATTITASHGAWRRARDAGLIA